MIWVSPNTGYPMSLWFISVSINTGPQWQRGDNDPRSPGCAQFFLLAFFGVGLSGLAYCILLLHNLATIFEHVGILVVWNMYFFHSVGNSNPNWRTPSFFRRVGLNHQPGWNIDELICGGFSAKDTKAHPYVFSTRKAAKTACKEAGYHGLCSKSQGSGGGFFTIRLFCVVLILINVNVI